MWPSVARRSERRSARQRVPPRRPSCCCASGAARSRPKPGAEALAQRVDDPPAHDGGLLVGQGPLGGPERDPEGERTLTRPDLLAAVLVEDRNLPHLGAAGVANRSSELR